MSNTGQAEYTSNTPLAQPGQKKAPSTFSLGAKLLKEALAQDPSGASLSIGLQIIKAAYDARGASFIVANRQDERIFEFFDEGVGWSREAWVKLHSTGPNWCAAFASYCYKKGHAQAGLPLPTGFSGAASCEGWETIFKSRKIPASEAISGNRIKEEVRSLLSPGDIVSTKGHVALLTGFVDTKEETIVHTIEGNTAIWLNGTKESEAWGIHPRDHRLSKLGKSLIGFLRATSAPRPGNQS